MKCRMDISGRKVWNDDNNSPGTRPSAVEVRLLRDGEIYDTRMLNSMGDGRYKFPCLIIAKNSGVKYVYTIDEAPVNGYTKTIQGYNITNTLNEIIISGTKIWNDNHNAGNTRPLGMTITLWQNGIYLRQIQILSTPAGVDTQSFSFGAVPFADTEGKPFVYTITENDIQRYTITIDGFTITNTLITRGFSFSKTSTATGLSLQGAIFEIRQNGSLITSSTSDAVGKVSFEGLLPGSYQMAETQPPVGYMDNTDIYEVVVDDDTITIDGLPVEQFSVKNTPKSYDIILRRATSVVPAYMAAPNTWPLHGTTKPDLYMLDKILITLPQSAVTVKWAYGMQDEAYFRAGGGNDITATYTNGIFPWLNSDYTVYAMFSDGTDTVASITIDRLRDGSQAMPYLLIDFTTAAALEPSITGIDQFTLYYMQGGGVKLSQHYEIYEDIDMDEKTWQPLGTLSGISVAQGFTGSLYGNGQDINGLTLGGPDRTENGLGLFRGVLDGAVIQDLGIKNYAAEAFSRAGGFAGVVNVRNGGTVLLKDLRFSGSLACGNFAGGIVSYAQTVNGLLIIDGCRADVSINNQSSAGAIIGSNFTSQETASVTISNCHSSGSVVTVSGSGAGIAGLLDAYSGHTSIINCVNFSNVEGAFESGGIVGHIDQRLEATISVSSCCNFGSISGNNSIGGIVGIYNRVSTTDGSLEIENCYNGGKFNFNAQSGTFHGGIIGNANVNGQYSLQNCYNTSDIDYAAVVSMTFNVGGIAGRYGNIANSASLGELVSGGSSAARISPNSISADSALDNNVAFDNMQVLINSAAKSPLDIGSAGADGISVTAAEIKTQTLYENTLGWDFTNIWSFGNGAYTLPILRGISASLQPTVLPGHLV